MYFFLSFFVSLAAIAAAVYFLLQQSRYYRLIRKLPSPEKLLVFGNAHHFFGKREDLPMVFVRLLEPLRSSSMVCLWIFHMPYIMITKHSSAEVILSSSQEIEKSSMYSLLHPWLGLGLLTSSGSRWRAHRKLLTPSFHFRILENFIPVFNEQSHIFISKLTEKAGNGIFDVYPYVTRCTLDVICETAMGKRVDSQLGKNSDYVNALATVSEMVMHRVINAWLLIPLIFELSSYGRSQRKCLKILHGFTNNVIKERRKEIEENRRSMANGNKNEKEDTSYVYGQKRRKAFLDTLLEASNNGEMGLTDEVIREQVDTFMFEGHDTTAVSISWVLYFLGWCPSVQEVVHEEVDRVFGGSDRPVDFSDLGELRYLEATIKESLRIVPSVPMFGRCLTQDVDIDGYKVPRGAEVFLSPRMIGTDPDVYQNPLNFDPTRFLNEDWQQRHPYAYVPFSAGPRNCIGQKFAMMEEKVILSNVLRNFEIRAYNSIDSIRAASDLVFRPINGMHISLEKRNR